jgi:serine/threonine protein kinase/Flp pilus assembly protein TadD
MTPERWNRVIGIFHSVLEQPLSQADEFLRDRCGDDGELYAEVRAMLEQHSRSGVLDQPVLTHAETAVFSAGQTISGRYRIVQSLGHGGMGEVYEAEDLELKERVALKTLLPAIAADERMIARFKQEIQLARKISHPNVCRVFDLARHPADGSSPETIVFLTMELVEGETLAARLQREGRLAPETVLPLLEQIAEALDAAHRAGVIHRDLKPSNVMLAPASEGPRVVVTDFGLARSFVPTAETTATLSGHIVGTLDYMAPELLTGCAATVASDIYALGMVAYKMVAGSLPFAGETPLAAAILRSKVPVPAPRSAVPVLDPGWDRAILRALEADPTRRFSSAAEFVKALRGEAPSLTFPLPAITRRRVAAAMLAVSVFAAGGIISRSWIRHGNQPSAEALAFYNKGTDDIHAGAYYAATKAFEEALRVAPRFSLAHARLAEAWNELDVSEKASQEMLLARRENTSSLSDLDRLQIEALDLTITREFAAAVGKYEKMRPLVTTEETGLDIDLGRAYEKAAQTAKAINSFRRAAEGPAHSPAAWLRVAVLYSRASDAAKAARAFQQAEGFYQLSSNLEGLIEVDYERGIDANRRRLLDEAAAHLHKALETAHLAGNIQQEIRAKLQLANNAYLSGDIAGAEQTAREALDTAQANQMEALVISSIVNLGNAYLRRRDFTGAERYYQDALALARRNSSLRGTALSLISLAGLHDQLKRSEDTAREAREALAYYQANGFAQESFQCLTLLGRTERYRGNYAAALNSFQRSLPMAEKSHDRSQMALAHESIGAVLFYQQQYPEALKEYQKDLELSADPEHAGYAGLSYGNTLRILGRYPEAQVAFDHADARAEKFDALRLNLALARAEMSLDQNLYGDAAMKARRSLPSDNPQNSLTVADLKRVLGLSLLAVGNKKEGLISCQESLAQAVNLADVAGVFRARLALLQARLETGDREGALDLFHEMERDLPTHPESHWRALALMARLDTLYAFPARQALEKLRAWGESAYRTYLARPDVQKLSRPILQAVFANQK